MYVRICVCVRKEEIQGLLSSIAYLITKHLFGRHGTYLAILGISTIIETIKDDLNNPLTFSDLLLMVKLGSNSNKWEGPLLSSKTFSVKSLYL